jgi:hypothetical protein
MGREKGRHSKGWGTGPVNAPIVVSQDQPFGWRPSSRTIDQLLIVNSGTVHDC